MKPPAVNAMAAPCPRMLRVWCAIGGWRAVRVVRYARDGRRVAVRFYRSGRWSSPRYVALVDTRPVIEAGQ